MTEFNPAAEADKLVQRAIADAAKAGATIETDVEGIKTDITGEAEKVLDTGPLARMSWKPRLLPRSLTPPRPKLSSR
jgi:hypothetical protein